MFCQRSAPNGVSTGIIAFAEDLDTGDNIVGYSLSDDAGGLFAIDSETGVITLVGELDYETSTSHVVSVFSESTDGSSPNTTDFTINVIDYNEYDI